MAPEKDIDQTEATADESPSADGMTPDPAFEPGTPIPPAKNRTGLIVVVAALLLLLVAGVALAMSLIPAAREATGSAEPDATKAQIEATMGAMKALRINDYPGVKPFLTDEAQNAVTPAQWSEIATMSLESGVASATFSPAKWAGETTATVDYDIDGATGTMTFSPAAGKPNVVTMNESGVDGELVYDFELVAVGSSWRVLSITPKAETYPLDAEFVKSLLEPVIE